MGENQAVSGRGVRSVRRERLGAVANPATSTIAGIAISFGELFGNS